MKVSADCPSVASRPSATLIPEGGEPSPPGVILTDHIPGDCSPPRALRYTQRTSLDTPEGATERHTTLRMSGGTPPPVATKPRNSRDSNVLITHVLVRVYAHARGRKYIVAIYMYAVTGARVELELARPRPTQVPASRAPCCAQCHRCCCCRCW
eukprot:COSAG02_NODE_98_length_37150_cov_39.614207_27_plen_154_part_00